MSIPSIALSKFHVPHRGASNPGREPLATTPGSFANAADIGGPLAFVRDGDLIELDVAARKLELKVSDAELAKRRAAWKQAPPHYTRGFGALYEQRVTQANLGCDFDFLAGTPGQAPLLVEPVVGRS